MKEIKVMVFKPSNSNAAVQMKRNQEVLQKLRKENRKRKLHKRIMLGLTSILVLSVVFGFGMILGRLLAFLQMMGC